MSVTWAKMAKIEKTKLILFAILIIASVLRFWGLDKVPFSLFGDELDVGYHAYSILKTGRDYSGNFLPLHFQSLAEWRTPLYLYSAVPTVAAFGISPLGVRLPAALFGILGIWLFYLLVKLITGNWKLATLGALLLAISPWHIQYSRAGFEVTLILFLFFAGLIFFFKGLKEGKWLVVSAALLALTPWAYSTAKLFTPLLLTFLFVIWRKELFLLQKKYLIWAAIALFVVGTPIAYSTLIGGGTARFAYISVFTDPTTEPEVGFARLRDALMRGETAKIGLTPEITDRIFHNKFVFWFGNIFKNYLQTFSTSFLFINGDPNARHSIQGMGELYKIELIPLLLGLILFFTRFKDKKIKYLVLFWLLVAPIPSAITRDGGNHATRLIILLPALLFLIAYGLVEGIKIFKAKWRFIIGSIYVSLFVLSFIFYQHKFWVHYPWDSERWWHAGFKDAIRMAAAESDKYERVIISMAGEPALIFFLGWSQYPPDQLHAAYLAGTRDLPKENIVGFGEISKLGKYYFGSPGEISVYQLGSVLPENSLYVATAKEVNVNLILEPGRKPGDLELVKAVTYPSGEPAFYLFTK